MLKPLLTLTRHSLSAVALLSVPVAVSAQTTITGSLVANDPIHAQWVQWPGGAPGANQSHPAGPLTSAAVQVNHAGFGLVAAYNVSVLAVGNGLRLTANSSCQGAIPGIQASTHADLTLTLAGPATRIAGIQLELDHGGDFADAGGFQIDVGDDGSVEVTSSCGGCASPVHHRRWTWDFAQGALPIRIRTNQVMWGGAQGYGITLDVQPWATAATPTGPDCAGVAYVSDPIQFHRESSNYQLSADEALLPQQLAILRATGLGQFGAYVIADQPTVAALTLPSPFSGSCELLSGVLWLDFGTVTASTTIAAPPTAREWQLVVPILPPGLTFHVQYASIEPTPPFWFGTTNRIRIDS